MSKHTDAADAIRRLARLFQPMVAVADELERLGSVEQAVAEAETAKARIAVEREQAAEDLAAAKQSVKDAREQAKKIKADAEDKAAAVINEARGEADAIKAAAEADAKTVTDNATRALSERTAELRGVVEELVTARNELTNELEARRGELAEVNALADAAEARLATAKAEIARMLAG